VAEARAAGLAVAGSGPGGVDLAGGWAQVMRANLALRIPTRVLWRVGAFRAPHLAVLDKRARRFPWGDWLRPDVPVRVEATTQGSQIWHAGAAAERIGRAIVEDFGAPLAEDAPVTLKARIADDLVTLSLDTSGPPLHQRGHKLDVGKAPLRESLAAGFLAQAGFDGTQALVDPMCGSGTLVLEGAEIAARLAPGRSRGYSFQHLAGYDPTAWAALALPTPPPPEARFWGYDRDDGAIRAAQANARRAGVDGFTAFRRQAVSDLTAPDTPPGLVLTNPPWGTRIGERKPLFALYGSLGAVLARGFRGWRVGVIAPDAGLIAATGLGLQAAGPVVDAGGIKVRLWLGAVG
jgi:putative N6-adenine-specific DNA methylase